MQKILIVGCMLSMLAGCAGGAKPAPEPDMEHLVPVNTSIPAELAGQVLPSQLRSIQK